MLLRTDVCGLWRRLGVVIDTPRTFAALLPFLLTANRRRTLPHARPCLLFLFRVFHYTKLRAYFMSDQLALIDSAGSG